MNNFGWAAVAISAVGTIFYILNYLLEQVPSFSRRVSAAALSVITALTEIREAWQRMSRK
ncbi:hypothetical protein [Streptomyces albospinus]|uniref:hypothetical protein n=1 Tax=Streptomyces albospinus TaxID=285515 RepID=UPI001670DDD2|nr:hypothetical protein [Streptomyces albospinus]